MQRRETRRIAVHLTLMALPGSATVDVFVTSFPAG